MGKPSDTRYVLLNHTRKAKRPGGQFHNARTAAMCLENAVSLLWRLDRDFGRFKELKAVNPSV